MGKGVGFSERGVGSEVVVCGVGEGGVWYGEGVGFGVNEGGGVWIFQGFIWRVRACPYAKFLNRAHLF